MCGRYDFGGVTSKQIHYYFDVNKLPSKIRTSRNISPGTEQLTIVKNSPNAAKYMTWGFRTAWFKKPGGVINARAETIAEKPMFKNVFMKSRCIIPATGFYEWGMVNKERLPYYIRLKDQNVFGFAGIYDYHQDSGGKDHFSFAIITTKPNSLVAKIHDRMPVILHREDHNHWLDIKTPQNRLHELLQPFKSSYMKAHIVSKRVNNPVNDDEKIVEPVE